MDIRIKGMERLLRKMNAATQDLTIRRSMDEATLYMQAWVTKNRLTGPRPTYLGVVTGRLRASITAGKTSKTGNTYKASIGTNVVYGPVHEFGFRARNIPARPFLRPALEERDNQRWVINRFVSNIKKAMVSA